MCKIIWLKMRSSTLWLWVDTLAHRKKARWDAPTFDVNFRNWSSTFPIKKSISHQIDLKKHVELFLFQFPFQGYMIHCCVKFRSFQLVKAAIRLSTLHWEGERDSDYVSDHTYTSFFLLRRAWKRCVSKY